jgi:hypothetical protein
MNKLNISFFLIKKITKLSKKENTKSIKLILRSRLGLLQNIILFYLLFLPFKLYHPSENATNQKQIFPLIEKPTNFRVVPKKILGYNGDIVFPKTGQQKNGYF